MATRPDSPDPMNGNSEPVIQAASPKGNRTLASLRARMLRPPLFATLRAWQAHILEVCLILGAYVVYLLTRGLVFSDLDGKGLENAGRVISAEKSLGVFWEPGWQSWVLDHAEPLALFLNWAYIFTYWPIILAVGLGLYFWKRQRYYYYRSVVVINLIFALAIFMFFPVTSPFNMGADFVNTIQALGPSFYGSPDMAAVYNTNAAMPSLHFSWTVILGVQFVRLLKGWFKLFGILYPVATFFAIIVTANHFILDAVAGGVLAAAAFGVMELGFRRGLFRCGLFRREGKWAGLGRCLGGNRTHSPETLPPNSSRRALT